MSLRREDGSFELPNVTAEQAIEMFGPIPTVLNTIKIIESQVPEEYGHVPGYEQEKMYFIEMMRIMEAKGIGFRDLMERGVFASVATFEAQLARELRVGDEVKVATGVTELDRQVLFEQEMERGGKHVSKNSIVISLRGRANTMIPIPTWVSEKLRVDTTPQEMVAE